MRSRDEIIKDGFVIIDKPLSPTSSQVTSWVMNILNLKKAGHAGTLDPNASGVLPIAFGKAMKLLELLSKSDKEYVALADFRRAIEPGKLLETTNQFVGEVWQMPPKIAAVKRRLRKRKVYSIDLLEVKNELVLFKAKVQHGTYIRKIIQDWGELLGVKAKMVELRRIKSGPFSIKDAVTLQELIDNIKFYEQGLVNDLSNTILPIERGVAKTKKVILKNSSVSAVCHGADLARPGVAKFDDDIQTGNYVAMMTKKNELVAIGIAKMDSKTINEAKRGIVVKTEKVIMNREKYPKVWKIG